MAWTVSGILPFPHGPSGKVSQQRETPRFWAGNDGTIWTGVVKGLAKLAKGEVTVYRQRAERGTSLASQAVHERIDRHLPERFDALLQDHNGRLWISSPDGLGYLEGEQFHAVPPFGARVILSLAEEPAGNLWMIGHEEGLFRIRDGRMIQHIPWDMVIGLWTPIVGALVALTELSIVLLLPQDLRLHVLQAVFGIGLAMIGPGVWSVDARLYGWRRLEIPTRKS